MADSQSLKKSKKKKKKPAGNSNASSDPLKTNNCIKEDKVVKDNTSITDILPLKVGMSAMFKDVEVTMTKCEVKNDLPTATSSKKKKKKKSKKVSEETPKENEPANLLSFNENRIELVNHPEISVTVSKVTQSKESKENELPKVEKIESSSLPEPKNSGENMSVNTTKKKKKKKKKKHPETKEPTETKENVTEDNSYTSPTYVKLPASGDSLVLVVSHESFSNGTKSVNSTTDKGKSNQSGLNTVLTSSEKSLNNVVKQNPSALVSEMQLSNTVRIFPVPNDTNKVAQTPLGSELKLLEKDVSQDKSQVDSNEFRNDPSSNILNVENVSEEGKTKAQLKAERRAKQEAQRAAKMAKNNDKEAQKTQAVPEAKSIKESIQLPTSNVAIPKIENEKAKGSVEKDVIRKVRLFSHLPQCKLFKNLCDVNSKIHPAILEVGYQYSKGIICGSNARCIALLAAFSKVINGHSALSGKDFSRDLESKLQTYLNFLNNCRPLSVSMINAVKFLKHQINHVPKESEECKIKKNLNSFIYDFVNDEILLAKEAIGNSASAKIVNGDVILVFSYSSLVKDVLCKAHNQDKKFQVIVVDSRPKMEGLEMLRRLVKQGLHCSYVSITALSYVMKEVSKVIIGAHALLSNGCVMSRLGCKQVALVASSYSVPVLVCCETYKFCERVLTDSFVHNELGDPEELVNSHLVPNNNLLNWRDFPSLQLLNLLYDVTPPDLISMVITEKGVLPCTSVPVVLRVRHAGLHE